MKLPIGPLEAVARGGRLRCTMPGYCPGCAGPDHPRVCVSDDDVAEHLGVTVRTLYRWRHEGVRASTADRLAIRMGTHPQLVWGDAWNVQEILDELAAELGIRRRAS